MTQFEGISTEELVATLRRTMREAKREMLDSINANISTPLPKKGAVSSDAPKATQP